MKYVLFHDDSDGFASAIAASKTEQWCYATYIQVQYNQPFPEQVKVDADAEILIVDFSYSREILEDLHSKVKSLLVIDHHKTAQTALAGLEYAVFDLKEAGATLTWKYFHGDKPIPDLIKFVGDRDLWKFEYPESRWLEHGIHATGSGKSLAFWDRLFADSNLFAETLSNGKQIHQYITGVVDAFVKAKKYSVRQFPELFKLNNAPTVAVYNTASLISETAEAVYTAETAVDFVMSYFILPDTGKVVFSLRAAQAKTVDLGQLAKCFGGGGHPKAAGFSLPYDEAEVFVNPDYQGSVPSTYLEAVRALLNQ